MYINITYACSKCVRFAPLKISLRNMNEKSTLLCTASDDKTIQLFQYQPNVKVIKEFGQKDINIETWTRIAMLTGHKADVHDVSWSADASKIICIY